MDELISDIEAFCRDQNLSEWQFGELALRDRKFIGDLRRGRDIRMGTVEKIRSFMAEYPSPEAPARAA